MNRLIIVDFDSIAHLNPMITAQRDEDYLIVFSNKQPLANIGNGTVQLQKLENSWERNRFIENSVIQAVRDGQNVELVSSQRIFGALALLSGFGVLFTRVVGINTREKVVDFNKFVFNHFGIEWNVETVFTDKEEAITTMREALRKLREYFWVLDTVPRFGKKTVVKLFEQGRSLQHIATLYDFDEKEEMVTLKPVLRRFVSTVPKQQLENFLKLNNQQ